METDPFPDLPISNPPASPSSSIETDPVPDFISGQTHQPPGITTNNPPPVTTYSNGNQLFLIFNHFSYLNSYLTLHPLISPHLPSDNDINLTLLLDYFDTVFVTHPEPERTFSSHYSPPPAQSTRLQKGEKIDNHIKSLVPTPRISPRFANNKTYVLERRETLSNYFIQTTRRAHRSLMQSPRPDVGYYLDLALKNASNQFHPLSRVNIEFIMIFHIPIAYTTLKSS